MEQTWRIYFGEQQAARYMRVHVIPELTLKCFDDVHRSI